LNRYSIPVPVAGNEKISYTNTAIARKQNWYFFQKIKKFIEIVSI